MTLPKKRQSKPRRRKKRVCRQGADAGKGWHKMAKDFDKELLDVLKNFSMNKFRMIYINELRYIAKREFV